MSDYYNEKVKKWDDMLVYSPAPRMRRKIILRMIRLYAGERASLLDIGCANGLLLNEIRNEFGQLILSGSDISNEAVALNKNTYPEINFINMDIGQVIDHDEQYDVITCSEVLEHVPDLDAAIHNIKKLLKPGGIAILTLPSGKIYPIDKMVGHLQHFKDTAIFKAHFIIKHAMHWGFPFFNLYKWLINIKPEAVNESFAESKYSMFQKLLSHFIYMLFQFNLPFGGEQLIMVLQKKDDVH